MEGWKEEHFCLFCDKNLNSDNYKPEMGSFCAKCFGDFNDQARNVIEEFGLGPEDLAYTIDGHRKY